MPDTADTVGGIRAKGLGFWYRIGWRVNYGLLAVYGPPTLGGRGEPDPRTLMRADREARRLSRLGGATRPATRAGEDARSVTGQSRDRIRAPELNAQDAPASGNAPDGPARAA